MPAPTLAFVSNSLGACLLVFQVHEMRIEENYVMKATPRQVKKQNFHSSSIHSNKRTLMMLLVRKGTNETKVILEKLICCGVVKLKLVLFLL